jgi:hypothetical protein
MNEILKIHRPTLYIDSRPSADLRYQRGGINSNEKVKAKVFLQICSPRMRWAWRRTPLQGSIRGPFNKRVHDEYQPLCHPQQNTRGFARLREAKILFKSTLDTWKDSAAPRWPASKKVRAVTNHRSVPTPSYVDHSTVSTLSALCWGWHDMKNTYGTNSEGLVFEQSSSDLCGARKHFDEAAASQTYSFNTRELSIGATTLRR